MQIKTLICCTSTIMAISLVGCDVDTKIDSASQAKTFETVDFNAKVNRELNMSDIQYSWDFGDGTVSNNQNPKHIYGKPGTYHVNLTAFHKELGLIRHVKKDIKITSSFATQKNKVLVRVVNDKKEPLKNAIVKVDGQKLKTNKSGLVTFSKVKSNEKLVLSAKAKNFITQNIQLRPTNNASRVIEITLKEKAPNESIFNIRQSSVKLPLICPTYYDPVCVEEKIGGKIVFNTYGNSCAVTNAKGKVININDGACSADLLASERMVYEVDPVINYKANSFMTANGVEAIGAAKISVTHWTSNNPKDAASLLGQGVAVTKEGKYTQLKSLHTVNVDIKKDGKPLKLKPGKFATISIPLQGFDFNYNNPLSAGDKVPMWSFSENMGVWIPEGEAEVVSSKDPHDLSLHLEAKISHLGAWNIGYQAEINEESMKCELANGNPVPCTIQSVVSLQKDGGRTYPIRSQDLDINGSFLEFISSYTPSNFSGSRLVDNNSIVNYTLLDGNATYNFIGSYLDKDTGIVYVGSSVYYSGGWFPHTIVLDSAIPVNKQGNKSKKMAITCHLENGLQTSCSGTAEVDYINPWDNSYTSDRVKFTTDSNNAYNLQFKENYQVDSISINAFTKENNEFKTFGIHNISSQSNIPNEVDLTLVPLNKNIHNVDVTCLSPDGKNKACEGELSFKYMDINTGEIDYKFYDRFSTNGTSPYKFKIPDNKVALDVSFITETKDQKYYAVSNMNTINQSTVQLKFKSVFDNNNPEFINLNCNKISNSRSFPSTRVACQGTAEVTYRDIKSDKLISKNIQFNYDPSQEYQRIDFGVPSKFVYSIRFNASQGEDPFDFYRKDFSDQYDVKRGIPSVVNLGYENKKSF